MELVVMPFLLRPWPGPARIALACADGKDCTRVAAELRATEHTVARWRGWQRLGGRPQGRSSRDRGRPQPCDRQYVSSVWMERLLPGH
jgi:hypothetical protein